MKLINRIRTSRIIFRLVYLLSAAANLFAPKFSREENSRRRRAGFIHGDFINGQLLKPVCDLPYGAYTMGYNGCEVIAVYNLLLMLGRGEPFADIADYFERRALLLNGWGGTNIDAVGRFLRLRGIDFVTVAGGCAERCDAALEESRGAVFSFWTGRNLRDANGRWNTLHTVALNRSGGGISVFNAFGNDTNAAHYSSAAEYISKNDLLPVALFAVR